ncbi:TerB family tellurite resistance protein [Yoonia sp. BS5-3]|uniref:TerB family tellurite resistance protein n=1 Tax=Yoonia phaeophyticola TaxID=3137369 RepID=A0ABZ2V2V5_9RHOB
MFFIIWGWRGRQREVGAGEFYCPDCRDRRGYRLVAVARWFTLYWIPLFKTKELGQFVECTTCKSTFNERVLEMDPQEDARKFEAAFSVAAKRVMFKMALADGDLDPSEVDQIVKAFSNIAKREIDPADIEAEIEAARDDQRSISAYVAEVAPGLNDTGKEIILRSAISVAKADGVIDPSEIADLHELAKAIDLPKAYANGIFAEESIQQM